MWKNPHNLKWRAGLLVSILIIGGCLTPIALSKTQRPSFHIASPLSRSLQSVLGITTFTRWIAQSVIEKQLRKSVDGDIDVHLKLYSATDLSKGKLARVQFTGNNLVIKKSLSLSKIEASNSRETPIWYDIKKKSLQAPVRVTFQAIMSENDINQTLNNPKIAEKLTQIKIKLPTAGKQTLSLTQSTVQLLPNQVIFETHLGIAGQEKEKALPIRVSSHITLDVPKNKLFLQNLDIAPIQGVGDVSAITVLLEDLFAKGIEPNSLAKIKGTCIYLKQAQVEQKALHLAGDILVLPKSPSSSKINCATIPSAKQVNPL